MVGLAGCLAWQNGGLGMVILIQKSCTWIHVMMHACAWHGGQMSIHFAWPKILCHTLLPGVSSKSCKTSHDYRHH